MASFNLQAARNYATSNKKDNGLDVDLVNDAINSIEKRIKHLDYFYFLFISASDKSELMFDRIGESKDGDGFVTRHKYEATAFAFLSTLHELIDSYPFIYLGIHKPKISNPKYLDWRQLEDLQSAPALSKAIALKKSSLFIKLDTINNVRKHRALPRVSNNFDNLTINVTEDKNVEFVDLRSLMQELHDALIPQYFEVLKLTFPENN